MLTRIEIDGFKTFKDFALDVPPFLVVLGQNASGKSNLFDAIAFLARLAQGEPVMKTVREDRAQLHELLNADTAGNVSEGIRFAVELTVQPPAASSRMAVRYEIDLRVPARQGFVSSGSAALVITDERWFVADSESTDEPRQWSQLTYTPAGETPEDEAVSLRYPSAKAFRPDVSSVTSGQGSTRVNAVIGAVRRQLAGWRVLALQPSALRRSDTFDDDDRLTSAGEHLPNALARIVRTTQRPRTPEGPFRVHGALNDLAADLADVVPDVVGLRLDDDQVRRMRTVLVRTRGQAEYSASVASDGTLRALALLAALRDPEESGLLCLEEPENGIYPHLLVRFVGRIRQWVDDRSEGAPDRQVLISSHSPTTLAALPPMPTYAPLRDDVIFLDLVSRTVPDRAASRVSRARRVRTGAPLPAEVPRPVVSMAEIQDFLAREGPW